MYDESTIKKHIGMNCAFCTLYIFSNFYKNVNKTSYPVIFHLFKKQQYRTRHYISIIAKSILSL